jgi:signal transduction histidine kinase
MNQALQKARTRLTLLTMLVATFCALLSVVGTYFIAQARMDQSINAARLGQLAEVNPELSKYLDSQEGYSAHFDSIAQIIQREDRKQLLSSLPLVFGSVFVVSSLLGWLLAQKLLQPVNEAYAVQRRFMQDAAHELRNPLAAMKSILQQSLAQKINDKRLSANLASLERQTDHLTNITTDLLLLERTESKPVKSIDIVPLLHDVIEGLHYKSQRKGVKVVVAAPDTLNAVISPSHFVAISKNIIDNAIKFSPSGKKAVVTVNLANRSGGWKLTVIDKGVGIKKSEHKHLTQRFYRASNSVEIEGTGLGLAIVSKYVSLYEGNLQIISSPGKGTTVTITC